MYLLDRSNFFSSIICSWPLRLGYYSLTSVWVYVYALFVNVCLYSRWVFFIFSRSYDGLLIWGITVVACYLMLSFLFCMYIALLHDYHYRNQQPGGLSWPLFFINFFWSKRWTIDWVCNFSHFILFLYRLISLFKAKKNLHCFQQVGN